MEEKKDKKEEYKIQNLLNRDLCPECGSKVMLVWTSKGKTFECTKCRKVIADKPYPPPKLPDHMKKK